MPFTKGNKIYELRKIFGTTKHWLGKKRPDISGENHHLFGKGHSPKTIEKIKTVIQEKYKDGVGMGYQEGHIFYPGAKLFNKGHIPWNKGKGKESKSFVYPKEHYNDKFRREIKERDNYICQGCGITEEEHLIVFGKLLSIHHIDYIKTNMNKLNLISTCNQCNVRANFNREHWIEFYKNKLMPMGML